ncbi:D-aminoacylase [Fimbriimonadia bacterium ATM]|nr:MAG: D-aminoacylase [Armatimonadota bacterium]MBC6969130.1 D-aminoacylase [Armatimonadota bacterium]MCE7900427.1 D-aminoacylase [Armatimonadetes bacterium ATM1]MDL1928318.1 D-aminoacylase [Fimbriimonadia bacterium ATM]
MTRRLFLLALAVALAPTALAPLRETSSLLIKNGLLIDGTGSKGRILDVRIEGGRIVEIGRLAVRGNEKVLDATDLVVAPGFIDAHSHTDNQMVQDPMLESQVRQGITTAIVGQDGGSELSISKFFDRVRTSRPTINFATFCGHAVIREEVMGADYKRGAKDSEVEKMKVLVDEAMREGALGFSTGLEYDPGYYATTVELVELAKVAAKHKGIYISHIREDGTAGIMQALSELKIIAKEAKIPAQISHIKVAVAEKWHKSREIVDWCRTARKEGLDITADVYPYLYWQSNIAVLSNDRNWENREIWVRGLAEVGGAQNVTIVRYTPDPTWEYKTLAELSKETGKDAPELIQEILRKTRFPGSTESHSIICQSMIEEDLATFMREPWVMFCSDGYHGGPHPRGAGSFPRVFGRYVRELSVLSLEEAIRKATSLPAKRFGLKDRGEIKKGMVADIVVFDPKTISDRATIRDPKAFSVGVEHVLVNGVLVLESGKMTGARPGVGLKRQG